MQRMTAFSPAVGRVALTAAALALCASHAAGASAQFSAPDADFAGQVRVIESPVVLPGDTVKIAGSNFTPGQQVRFFYENVEIAAPVAKVDEEGKFTVETSIPADAVPGRHPIVVSATNPNAALVYPLKVSPDIALSGADGFDVTSRKVVAGLYQAAYSPKNKALFVTSSVGRPPIGESALVKLNPDTLEIIAQVAPQAAPPRRNADGKELPGGLYGVYGVGVDDANDTVWTTVTRQNTVAVYKQSDLSLVKQFPSGEVAHSRDVVIDTQHGKAYVSTSFSPEIEVFDTKKLEKIASIAPETTARGPNARPFSAMSLALDPAASRLYVISATGEIGVIDTQTDSVEKVIPVKGVFSPSGIAFDPATKRAFVAAQGSDNVAIVDVESGETLHNVLVGAGALNVAFDPVSKLAYVTNRGAGTITALNSDGEIVANLDGGPQPNHATVGPDGIVYVVNKGRADDPASNQVHRIQRK